uniref:Ycf12 n=1 Tax=Sargassum horneri TaxID=74089 RepID=A0A141BSI3_9PHAE|nr:Ycf12 [Sargassum horneri]AKO62532.1 Ycf12 [Sargassum horneri]QJC59406.1 Ycf12 [Sargassum horneri]QNU09379.1 Ycf12 [Sargassum horneri]QNU09516.1 Ycf12 [Sargassum horneri]UVW81169.1 Photosystem II reaction center protein Ycf12 [Sargassum horneri]
MNWQVIGQVITAALIIISGPLIIFIAKKAEL